MKTNEIHKDMKVSELLSAFPVLYEILPKINPKFALIKNPIAKSIVGSVTLVDVAKKGGMECDALIQRIKYEIGKHND